MMEKKDYTGRSHILFDILTNKYVVVSIFFILWITLFGHNSLLDRVQLSKKIATLKKEKTYYQEKIAEDSRKMQELVGNKKKLEKFAREQYLMKKPDEDIFVIVNE